MVSEKTCSEETGSYCALATTLGVSTSIVYVHEFKTTWAVPSNPPTGYDDKELFLWNGLQTDDPYYTPAGVLQPVLMWDVYTKSWYAISVYNFGSSPLSSVTSKRVAVNIGDVLTGRIAFISRGQNNSYRYITEFVGLPDTQLILDLPCAMNLLVECFEPYTDGDYRYLPDDLLVKMRDINVTLASQNGDTPVLANIDWKFRLGEGVNTPSGINGVIINSSAQVGEIDFHFR